MAYDYADVADLDAGGPGGMVRFARKRLNGRAFGFNYFVFPPNQEGREHDHAENAMEEVYFIVKGGGTMLLDGEEELELRPGRLVRVDPETRRVPVSGDDGLEYIVFGAPLQGGYEPPPWG